MARPPVAPKASPPPVHPLLARKWFAPAVLGVLAIIAAGVIMATRSSGEKKPPPPPDPRKTGGLVVKSNLADAAIEATPVAAPPASAPSEFKGVVGQALAGLPPGRYHLVARVEGWPDATGDADITAGHTSEVAVDFKSGSLQLTSEPAGANVKWRDTVLGRTPLTVPRLPPGECHLVLEYRDWPPLAFTTTVAENVVSSASAHLPHGRLMVETVPAGATVRLGPRVAGQTPLTLEEVPAGQHKLKLEAPNFPALLVTSTVPDNGEARIKLELGVGFPVVNPAELLRSVWMPDQIAQSFDSTGRYEAKNGIVKNLNRKRLYENWLKKSYRFSGVVTGYDPAKGEIEFAEDKCDLSRYRVFATLAGDARADAALNPQTIKGTALTLYGRLAAVEEPRWPSKVIRLELEAAALLHPETPGAP